jgi:hypothetical protein
VTQDTDPKIERFIKNDYANETTWRHNRCRYTQSGICLNPPGGCLCPKKESAADPGSTVRTGRRDGESER